MSKSFGRLFQLYSTQLQSKCIPGVIVIKSLHLSSKILSSSDEKSNIFLIGSPGSGKTTVGQLLAAKLHKEVIDIDNDYLESYWKMPVSQKLTEVGSDGFLEAEGQAFLQFQAHNSVISTTGSNPMIPDAVQHMKRHGRVLFLDVEPADILQRLECMKVSRIVGQNEGTPMSEILDYRQQFYEGSYDARVLCSANESAESIAEKADEAVNRLNSNPGFTSTRENIDRRKSFDDVVLEGLAPGGGLYVPRTSIPKFSLQQWTRLVKLTYPERALRILEAWNHPDDLHPSILAEFINSTYTVENFESEDVFPVQPLKDNVFTAELFHGPTASFKDAALQLMPKFFSRAIKNSKDNGKIDRTSRYLILVATSGDTGGAVLYGFRDITEKSKVKVMVMYPEDGVSQVQKSQMTSVEGQGLHVVGIQSDFDFCQSTIKQLFSSSSFADELKEKHNVILSAANSINWGRLLPQVVYHCSSYLDLVKQKVIAMGDPVDLCIPTGNFGNILAAQYAKMMGIPYRRMICASNENNVLTDFINTGSYDLTSRKLQVTPAPAIDILKSSNLERYLYHVSGGDAALVKQLYDDLNQYNKFQINPELLEKVQDDLVGDWCTEDTYMQTISQTYQNTGYVLDPHTAVGVTIADRFNSKDVPLLVSGTAHYAKFAPDVLQALSDKSSTKHYTDLDPLQLMSEFILRKAKPFMHDQLLQSLSKVKVHQGVLPANINAVTEEINRFLTDEK